MPASHPLHTPEQSSRFHARPIQVAARATGWISLLVSVVGLSTSTATNEFGPMTGHCPFLALMGFFDVAVAHSLIHLAVGLLGLAMSRTISRANAFLMAGAIVYLVVFGYGWVVADEGAANVPSANQARDWIDLGLGVLMMGSRVGLGRSDATPP